MPWWVWFIGYWLVAIPAAILFGTYINRANG